MDCRLLLFLLVVSGLVLAFKLEDEFVAAQGTALIIFSLLLSFYW